MKADGLEVVFRATKSAVHHMCEACSWQHPSRQVGIKTTERQGRLDLRSGLSAAEVGVKGPLDQPGAEPASLQPPAADPGLELALVVRGEDQAGFRVLGLYFIVVIEIDLNSLRLSIRQCRHAPKIGISNM